MINRMGLWIAAIGMLSACTTATSTSRQTVAYTEANKPKSMVVGVLIGNLEWRGAAEADLQKRINDRGVKAQRLLDVAAGRANLQTSDELVDASKASGADVLLVIWFMPGRVSELGNGPRPTEFASMEIAKGGGYRYQTIYVPSGPSTVYIASFGAALHDLRTGEKVWEAVVNTRSSVVDARAILNTAVNEAYSRLVADKLL